MEVRIYCVTDNKRYEITELVSDGISLSKSIGEAAWKMDFSIVWHRIEGLPMNPVKPGSVIECYLDNGLYFAGMVVPESRGADKEAASYTAMDFTFYFRQNAEIFQFNKKDFECVKEILRAFDAPSGEVQGEGVVIDKFYYNESSGRVISDIAENILKATGKVYRFSYEAGKFHFKKSDRDLYYEGKVTPIRLNNKMKPESHSTDLSEIRNSIKLIVKNGEQITVAATAKNIASIEKYGIFQHIEEIDEKDKDNAEKMAINLVKKMSRLREGNTYNFLGDPQVRDGSIVEIDGNVYEVTRVNFTYSKNIFLMSLEVEDV